MNNTENENKDLYANLWEFVMRYLPNYEHRDDVLCSDILVRYYYGEDVDDDDLEWIHDEYHDDKELVLEELVRLETSFVQEALMAYHRENGLKKS